MLTLESFKELRKVGFLSNLRHAESYSDLLTCLMHINSFIVTGFHSIGCHTAVGVRLYNQ
jgi:hypothetical protein